MWDCKKRNFNKELESNTVKTLKDEATITSQNILRGIPHGFDRCAASVEGMTRIVQTRKKVIERKCDRDQ